MNCGFLWYISPNVGEIFYWHIFSENGCDNLIDYLIKIVLLDRAETTGNIAFYVTRENLTFNEAWF